MSPNFMDSSLLSPDLSSARAWAFVTAPVGPWPTQSSASIRLRVSASFFCHAGVVFGIVVKQGNFRVVDSGELRRISIVDRLKCLGFSVAEAHILSDDLFLLGSYISAQKFNEVVGVSLGGVVSGRAFGHVLVGRRRILGQC